MRPLRYSINITLDGCADHTVGAPDAYTHRHAEEGVAQADALILGRTTYELMEFWRPFAQPGAKIPDGMPPWMLSFAPVIDKAKKYVVSSTLESVDWNAELIRDDLEKTVRALKEQPGNGLATGGLTLPLALAEMGLIDEYEFIVQPRLAGHGPYVFAGLSKVVELKLVDCLEFPSGAAVAMRYVPK
jgi:dihydrofolate reductase